MPASGSQREGLYLLDSSAILAYLLNEGPASRVAAIHSRAAIPFIAPAELYAALWLRFGPAKADEAVAAVRGWRLPWIWPSEEAVLLAGKWRAIHRLGLADSFIAALSFLHQATLVTRDSDYRCLQSDLRILFL